MKRPVILAAVLCLSLLSTGFSAVRKTPSVEPKTEKTTHQVTVVDGSRTAIMDKSGEYVSRCPKLIVDGEEAEDINASLSKHIQEKYPLELTDSGYADGYRVSYEWGVSGSIVSIKIYADYLSEDGGSTEAFNYDLGTLKQLKDSEVVKRLGMTDKQFFAKTADAYRNHWKTTTWLDAKNSKHKNYLNKSIKAINYDKITPYITPGGNTGVIGTVYYPDSQFDHSEVCFNLALLDLK